MSDNSLRHLVNKDSDELCPGAQERCCPVRHDTRTHGYAPNITWTLGIEYQPHHVNVKCIKGAYVLRLAHAAYLNL